MKLDSRIIEGKKPLTCFDIEEAREFEGKEGYFCDYPRAFAYGDAPLEKCATTGILELDVDRDYSHCPYINKTTCLNYPYFLPAEWVKPEEPEKKYRPLSYKEFWRLFDFGDGVCFRRKGQNIAEFSMFLGYEIDSDGNRAEIPGEGKVNLGGNRYTLAELFEYYELELNGDGDWQPFGIEDKE